MADSPWIDLDAMLADADRCFRTRVAPDALLVGVLSCGGADREEWADLLHIAGTVEGEITGYSAVVVEPGGKMNGRVQATTVILNGEMHGQVDAPRRLELQPGARFFGELATFPDSLVISPEAVFGRDEQHTDPLADEHDRSA